MQKIINLKFTPAGFDYVRRVLGQEPYDEAGPIIQNIELQRHEQENPQPQPQPQPAPISETPAAPVVKRSRAKKPVATLNGSGDASAAH